MSEISINTNGSMSMDTTASFGYYSPGYATTPDPMETEYLEAYENNLEKNKDERDAIQKKTFTKWVNKHLKNARDKKYVVVDLYKDLQNGENLLKLLELLSGSVLRRERGNFRVHKIQNVETGLRLLLDRNIKVVNIRPEDIVDGNPKLTLGLIWIIILHFQVSEPWGQEEGLSARDALLQWTQRVTQGYPGVHVKNFSNSWRDGLAFNAVLHRYNPRLVRWRDLQSQSNRDRLENAFATAEREFNVTRLLDAEDVDVDHPDEKSLITYISSLYDALPDMPEFHKYEEEMTSYNIDAREWLNWVARATRLMEDRHTPASVPELRKLLTELDRFKSEDMPPKLREKEGLSQLYIELQELFNGSGQMQMDPDLAIDNLDRQWNALLRAMEDREQRLRTAVGGASHKLTGLENEIGIINEKLDRILDRIEHAEANMKVTPPNEMKIILDRIVDDLEVLTAPIQNLFAEVDNMKAENHPEANNYYRLVMGLHQRQHAYLQRLNTQLLVQVGYNKVEIERYESTRTNVFSSCEECIQWIDERISGLAGMEFSEELPQLEDLFEHHKLEHRINLDFRQEVDKCIARQAEVSADDSAAYCDVLSTLESSYQQLRDLSTGRMLDLDSLIAFVRAAQAELIWINEREELEVSRNWSDIGELDLPMLQNYYKQLLHEIELREEQFNAVHNQGAALLNQGHPAVRVIEAYLSTMQSQWDWLLNLARCLETHLQDALNLKLFMEESQQCEEWMERQTQLLESHYNRSDFSLEEGEKMLKELEEIREMLNRYHEVLLTLIERSRILSPLWQRGERITKPLKATALCDYVDRDMIIHRGDECTLLDNSDLIRWHIRSAGGVEGAVPSVVFRLPPPDERLLAFLNRLQAQFERLRKLWLEKHRWIRFNMVLSTMHSIRGWDLEQFLAIDPNQRDDIMKALNDDAHKLIAELGDDPLALRLKEELRLANEHYLYLLQLSQKSNEPTLSDRYDEKIIPLFNLLEEAWKKLNDRVAKPVARDVDKLDLMINEHKVFEDGLQGLDSEVASLLELYRQLDDPTPVQKTRKEQLETRWDDLWVLSRMYVERLKALELVLNGMSEVDQIVKEHEITLGSFDKMPADVDRLRAVHSQLLELNMVLQQQQPILDDLALNVGQLRQHIARTRFNVTEHPDMDRLEDDVQKLTVRWENICQQVLDRLKSSEVGLQVLMVYRSDYKNEVEWLDRVEATINSLRDPRALRPEEYQQQLDILVSEYNQLQERTRAIEQVNNEGGKFIREAKNFDMRLEQYIDALGDIFGPNLRNMLRRKQPQPMSGADQVTKELEELNRRFSQLSSIILERRNVIQVLIQNWRRQQQDDDDKRRAEEEARRRAEEEARRLAAEEAERLRRQREEDDARRRAAESEAERLRRLREEEEARRRALEAQQWADDEARRRAEEEARRLAAEREARLRAEEEARRRAEEEARRRAEELERLRQKVQVDIAIKGEVPITETETSTFRSRLHVPDAGEGERAHVNLMLQARPPSPKLDIKHSHLLGEAVSLDDMGEFEEVMEAHEVAKVTEHEDETQMYHEETITKTQFYELEAVKHVQTGEILTFVEAVRQGLLDLTSGAGEFYDMVSGSKMSLEEAVQRGYISQSLNDCLQMQYGIKDPSTKEPLTLLQAIQCGIYDPDSRQLRDPETGEILGMYDSVRKGILSFENVHQLVKMGILKLPPIELEQAIDQNVINVETGQFTGRYTRETLPLKEALRHGYISIGGQANLSFGISLSDCIKNKFINPNSGEFNDKNSDTKFTLREALSKAMNLIDLQTKEIVNTNERMRVPVNQAMVRNILNTRQGNFTDLQQHQSMTLQEAHDKDLIQKPLSLKEIEIKDLIDSQGRLIDAGTKKRMTLLEAISDGLVDPAVRHINDPEHGDIISVAEALERGLLSPEGKFIHPETQSPISIHEAAMKGWLTEPLRHSIFDVKGVRNTKTGQYVSFIEAVQEGIIVLSSKRVVDLKSGESVILPDAGEKGLVDPTLHQALSIVLEFSKYSKLPQMSVFDAVSQEIIDPRKGVFVDKRYNQELSGKDAYEAGLLSLKSAIVLSALLNVHASLIPAEKTVRPAKRRIKRPGLSDDAEEQVKMTLADAMKQGLIDSRAQRFRQGNQEMSLHEAINQGLVDATNEWIIPSKAAGSGPTIQESITESVAETSQILAPKVYPDKNLEESVTTVKRQRVTETTAIGGPGGVSMYRAVTGSKGALEVPVDGLHIYDAERQGIVDLDTGLINPPDSDKTLTLEEGFELGVISKKAITVIDPKTRAKLTVPEAFVKNVLDQCGYVSDGRKMLSFRQAISNGIITVDAELPAIVNQSKKIIQFGGAHGTGPVTTFVPVGNATFEESETSWSFDSSTGEVVDGFTGERMPLDKAIQKEKLPKDQIRVRDTLTRREHPYDEACRWGIIDPERNFFVDKRDGRRYSLQDAATQGHIFLTGGVPENASDSVQTSMRQQSTKKVTTKEAVLAGPAAFSDRSLQSITDLGWYNAQSGTFTHPDTKKQMTLKEAIIKGLFNPYASSVTDSSGKELSLLDAIQSGIIDAEAGMIRDPKTGTNMDLQTACSRGLIKSGGVAETLEGAIISGRLDLSNAMLSSPSGTEVIPLHDAIAKGHIDGNSIIVTHPVTNEQISFAEARKNKLIDLSHGLLLNHKTGVAISFGQALSSGTIAPVKYGKALVSTAANSRSLTQQPSKEKHGIPQMGPAHGTVVQRHIGAGGLREELVDLGGGKQVMVKVLKSKDGVERGEYIDPNTGMKFTIQLHGDPYVTQTKTTVKSTAQVQSVELEPHAELVGIDKVRDLRTGRIMSLKDAQRAGLAKVDKKGKQITKTYGVFRSDIVRALGEGIVDPTTNERLSLEDAIRSRLVDIRSLTFINPNSGESFNFTQAANMGLMDVTLAEVLPRGVCNPASGEKIYMDHAIELGIINPRSGEVFNPFNKEKISWVDVLKPVYMSLTMEGVYDPRKGYAIPVTSALIEGILSPDVGYCNPITEEKIPLQEASSKGLIDEETYKIITREAITDWRSGRKINLMEAVRTGLIDPINRTVQLNRDVSTPIGRAVHEGTFPKDIGDKMKRVDKLNFAEALGKGLIDVAANQFMDPDTGRKMAISQAIEQGYIDTGSVESQEGNEDRNLAYIIDSDEFDANSGRIRDPKSNLYLTFRQAVDQNLIDPDSLVHDVDSKSTMTLKEACTRGTIDYNGKYIDSKTGLKVNLKDAVTAGLIALIASPMQAGTAVSEAMKRRDAEGFKFKMEMPEYEERRPPSGRSTVSETMTSVRYSPRKMEPSIGIRVKTDGAQASDRLKMLLDDPQALADKQYEFLQNLQEKQFDITEKIIEDPSLKRLVSTQEAVESGLLDVLSGEVVHQRTGQRFSIPKAVHLKLVQPGSAKSIMENLNLSLEDLYSTLSMLSPRSDASPRSLTSSMSPSSGFAYSKEVSWKGTPAELRANKGNLTAYTKISGSRDGGPQSVCEDASSNELISSDEYSSDSAADDPHLLQRNLEC